jgi:hypothetical protein
LKTKAYEHALADAARLELDIVQANLGQGSTAAVLATQ